MNSTNQVTALADTLRKAAELAELIQNKQSELNALLAGKALVETPVAKKGGKTGKRVLSPEARAAIIKGQAKRWAKVRREAKLAAKAAIVLTPAPTGTPEPAKGFETGPIEPTAE